MCVTIALKLRVALRLLAVNLIGMKQRNGILHESRLLHLRVIRSLPDDLRQVPFPVSPRLLARLGRTFGDSR